MGLAGGILGAIGGALEGTSNAWKQGSKMEDAHDIKWNNLNGGKSAGSGFVKGFTKGAVNVDGDSSTSHNDAPTNDNSSGAGGLDIKGIFSKIGGGMSGAGKAFSDDNLKCKYSKDADVVLEAYRNLDAIIYKYNNEAHQIEDDTGSIDNDVHLGVKAQDIERQPVLSSAVSTSENGYKEVDIKEMTLANTAAISELVKKVDELTKIVNGEI